MSVPSSSASAGDIQREVNKLFAGHRLRAGFHKEFNEFGDDGMERLKEFLKQLTKVGKDDLQLAIEYAIREIIVDKENPRLVKLALGIFLTHSRVAHRLGIVAPSLLHYNEFTATKDQPLSNPATGETMQGYGLLNYWREDYDFNDHHNHWHMVYPSGGNPGSDGTFYRTIDRQGELFLYMHSQMVARYNAELISWGLYTIATWQYDDIVTCGYTPSPFLIDDFIPRPPNQGWFEMYNPYLPESQLSHYATKATMIKWRDNIFRAIQDGYFITENTKTKTKKPGKLYLTADNAKNWVGVAVEAESVDLQETSPGSHEFLDKGLYGNLHNLGHNNFASIGYKGGSKFGVMGTNLASPRDPCFWLWHRHIDEFRVAVAKKYSHSLNEFKPEAELQELKIVPQDPKSATPKGGITTFLGPPQLHHFEVNAKVDHEPYQWEITIKSTSSPPASKSRPQVLTVRLFIVADVLQRDLQAWIEMDKFTYQLEQQETTIIRYDVDSAVARKTCPEEDDTAQSKWCKCGWPQNMMLPVGKPGGMPFRAFAILTDDKLGKDTATHAISFCGAEAGCDVENEPAKYPDPRGMGYPFDKTWDELQVTKTPTIDQVVADLPHALLSNFKIYSTTKNYQPPAVDPPPTDITWENTIKDFFTEDDVKCMKWKFDLSSHDDVKANAGVINNATSGPNPPMPKDEKKWTKEMSTKFQEWMAADCP